VSDYCHSRGVDLWSRSEPVEQTLRFVSRLFNVGAKLVRQVLSDPIQQPGAAWSLAVSWSVGKRHEEAGICQTFD
jgi:hypothetical protein